MRYFDTAPHYGLGLSERRLGAALAERPRDELRRLDEGRPRCSSRSTSSTGWTTTGSSFRRPTAAAGTSAATGFGARSRRAWSGSVSTASTSSTSTIRTTTGTRCWRPATRRSQSCGRKASCRPIGAGMNQSAMLADLVRHTDVDVLMLAGRYTLLEQDSLDDLLPALRGARCRDRRRGRLQQRSARARRSRRPAGSTTTATRRRNSSRGRSAIAAVCERHGTTLPAAAIAFPLAHPAVVSVCVGARSAEADASGTPPSREPIPVELWSELKARGTSPRGCPGAGS